MTRLTVLVGIGVLALASTLSGCGERSSFAIAVEVRSAETGEAAADRAVLIIRDGTYVDSVFGFQYPPHDQPLRPILLAGHRAGRYDVRVEHPAYETWSRSGVRVRRQGITEPAPRTVYLLAELVPKASAP